MASKRHVPPSRQRYEAKHPTISMRVSKEIHDKISEMKRKYGYSVGDLVRIALKEQEPLTHEYGIQGFEEARNLYRVVYACSICGKGLR